MTLFVVANGGTATRLGVAATRKLGSAVERNRAKRLAREVFRRNKIGEGLDIVIVPRREMLDASLASLETDYTSALERRGRERGRPASRKGSHRPARPAKSL